MSCFLGTSERFEAWTMQTWTQLDIIPLNIEQAISSIPDGPVLRSLALKSIVRVQLRKESILAPVPLKIARDYNRAGFSSLVPCP